MCGRFTLAMAPEDVASLLRLNQELDAELNIVPRWNIAPGQDILAAARPEAEAEVLPARFRWGLVPGWANDPSVGPRMINARSETAADKPSFRSVWRRRRCLIPADGFYEWKRAGQDKQPWLIRAKNEPGFCFAGLWESWSSGGNTASLHTCTILTTNANELMAPIHDRMPVILPPPLREAWLDPGMNAERLQGMMVSLPSDALIAHPVSDLVNSPRHDTLDCIEPVAPREESPDEVDPSQGTLF